MSAWPHHRDQAEGTQRLSEAAQTRQPPRLVRERGLGMKVFISWSGPVSHKVALALRDWLPSVIQSVDPYVSSEDIDKGARWSADVGQELEASDFGVLCITPTNTGAPWVSFEAGALSKSLARSRVVPLLFGLARAELPQGPLVQFQSVLAERDDIEKLVSSLNAACGDRALDETRLAGIFDVWWPRLEEVLGQIDVSDEQGQAGTPRSGHDVLAEILELVRGQSQLLQDPATLFPPWYAEQILQRPSSRPSVSVMVMTDLVTALNDLLDAVPDDASPQLVQAVENIAGRLTTYEEGTR